MILFDGVTYFARRNRPPILYNLNFTLRTDERVVLLALRGAGKTSLIKLLCGINVPRYGRVMRSVPVSFPVGMPVATARETTVLQVLQDAARLYQTDLNYIMDFLRREADAEALFSRKYSLLSKEERSQLMVPLTYALPFEYFLADDNFRGSARAYQKRFETLFDEYTSAFGGMFATSSEAMARQYADRLMILHGTQVFFFDDVAEGIRIFKREIQPLQKEIDGVLEEDEDDIDRREDVVADDFMF